MCLSQLAVHQLGWVAFTYGVVYGQFSDSAMAFDDFLETICNAAATKDWKQNVQALTQVRTCA